MYLDPFHASHGSSVTITPEQGSQFAKQISDDFNPLHNADSKRFCVPGDLLFALVLARYGLAKNMAFKYTGMVGKGVELNFPETQAAEFCIADTNAKPYLEVTRDGDISHNMTLIEAFSRAYVAFSGHSFPHILVPLMQKENVMINPDKPMVIYESMAFQFDDLSAEHPSLELTNSTLDVSGKRGLVRMEFDICESGQRVGAGYKTMVLSGLREFDQTKLDDLIQIYEQTKANYRS